MSLTSLLKGVVGEAMGSLAGKLFLDKETYRSINNVTLNTSNGTTQIDHVIASRYGIFVVETKNYQGWIFGGEKQAEWTYPVARSSGSRIRCARTFGTSRRYRSF